MTDILSYLKKTLYNSYSSLDYPKALFLFVISIIVSTFNLILFFSYIINSYLILTVIHFILSIVLFLSIYLIKKGKLCLASVISITTTHFILLTGFFNQDDFSCEIFPLFIITIAFSFYYIGIKWGLSISIITVMLFISDIIFNVSQKVNFYYTIPVKLFEWLILVNFIIVLICVIGFVLYTTKYEKKLIQDKETQIIKNKELANRYKTLIDTIPYGTAEIDYKGNILFTSKTFQNILGYDSLELNNKTLEKFVYKEAENTDNYFYNKIREIEELKIPPIAYYEKWQTKNNKIIDIQLDWNYKVDINKNITGFIIIITDITERKKYEEELKRSNYELSQFAHTISHDLKNPLISINSYINMLKREYSKVMSDEFINMTNKVSNRIIKLINMTDSLINLAGLKNNHKDKLTITDSNEVVNEAIDNLRLIVKKSEAIIEYKDLPIIKCDKFLMISAFQNLIDNAIKYTENKRPEIIIKGENRDSHWLFSVKDNGIGIDPKEKNDIFNIFYRNKNNNKNTEGYGIGLSYVKKIIERHKGEIWFDSILNEGTTFYFTITK
ncbi:MAG: PAS domain-containing sensor histidine kinase [bacterium]